jgi:DNA-binding response OmpR family regulator
MGGELERMSKRILVVDDESDVCFMLQKALTEIGYVDSFEDPLIALKSFRAHAYDLVILDIKMPQLNGFLLFREIRNLDKETKICFFTAGEMYYGIYSDIFSSLPANCFIRKPIDNDELLRRVNEILMGETTILARA